MIDPTKRSTILIVDDDLEVIEALRHNFRKRNYEPVVTADPKVVLQKLRSVQVDLLVLDLKMRTLNGFDILDQLQKEKIKVAILIVTGFLPEYETRLKKYGISVEHDVVTKPFGNFATMEAAINRKLGKAATLAEVINEYEDKIYLENECHVVLVDDETEIVEIIKEALEERNYKVNVFGAGDTALDFILSNDCQVCVIDMKIPHLPGHELIQKLLQAKPFLKIIPISASYEKEAQGLLESVSFDPSLLVKKPFSLPCIIEKIKVMAIESGSLKKS